jgi:N6-L-threonylcarbamoyladenine synthase
MRILGIETSCDETSAAIVEAGTRVESVIIASSREEFARSGGVIPEQAARRQVECIMPVIEHALQEANCQSHDIGAIAVTRGPGLLGSLLVGTTTARVLASRWHVPVIGVHHTLGHLSSTWLDCEDEIAFPILTLSASGGHTELWLRTSHARGQLLGRTRDDAAGEAFDKGASLLNLPYPGGPAIGKLAVHGNPDAHAFPSPLHSDPSFDFSFSGLKTSLRYLLRDLGDHAQDPGAQADIAASYELALCRHLVDRVHKAVAHHDVMEVHVVGGVAANSRLRAMIAAALPGTHVRFPQKMVYCTDNAAMIAAAGAFLLEEGTKPDTHFATVATLALDEALVR